MDAREYLSQAFVLSRHIKAKEFQLKTLKDVVPYTAPQYGDVKIDTNMRGSAVENAALTVIALSQEINDDIVKLSKLMDEIRHTISCVGNSEVENVLVLRYISFKSWSEMVSILGYSDSHVFRLHRLGLKKVAALI